MTNHGKRCFCCVSDVSWSVMRKHTQSTAAVKLLTEPSSPWILQRERAEAFSLYKFQVVWIHWTLFNWKHFSSPTKATRDGTETNTVSWSGPTSCYATCRVLTGLTCIYMELLTYVKNCNVSQETEFQSTGRLLEAVWTFHMSSYLFSRCRGLMSGLRLTCLLVFLNVSECLTVSTMLDCIKSCSCFTNYIWQEQQQKHWNRY